MTDLTALVGSRICHDLVNPLGAIGNGMELMAMTHAALASSEEATLIAQSLASAHARVRLMRLAFGAAAQGTDVAAEELRDILGGLYGTGRLNVRADALPASLPRLLAKPLLLAVMCAEDALPRGGRLDLTATADAVRLTAEGPRLKMAPELWTPLARGAAPEGELRPAEVQFALLPQALAEAGRKMTLTHGDSGFALAF